MQLNILCYGDSNTWGYVPVSGHRYPESIRWTGVLGHALGNRFKVIEEGLNGRTTALDDPFRPILNGLNDLFPCLQAHKPLDFVVLMLGTNDLKKEYGQSMAEIANHVGKLIDVVQESGSGRAGIAPEVLLVSPPRLSDLPPGSSFFDGPSNSNEFGKYYAAVAYAKGCLFLDADQVLESSPLDGVHWSEEGHAKFGKVLGELFLKSCF